MNLKKQILLHIPYVLIGLFATKLGMVWRYTEASGSILNIADVLQQAFQSLAPSFHPFDLCIGFLAGAFLRFTLYVKSKNAKKYRKNVEHGSARWGTAADIKPYMDPEFQNNVILTQTERLTMNSRPKNPAHARNKNVLIVGGSGSGKTRFWLKPNLMQCHSSYVVTDPKGSL